MEWLARLARADGVCFDFVDCTSEMGRLAIVSSVFAVVCLGLVVVMVTVCKGLGLRLIQAFLRSDN